VVGDRRLHKLLVKFLEGTNKRYFTHFTANVTVGQEIKKKKKKKRYLTTRKNK
jgi:hypothetical protein